MRVKRRNHPPEATPYEIEYWRKIREQNRTNPFQEPTVTEPRPVREYIIQTIELLKTDE